MSLLYGATKDWEEMSTVFLEDIWHRCDDGDNYDSAGDLQSHNGGDGSNDDMVMTQ